MQKADALKILGGVLVLTVTEFKESKTAEW